MCNTAPKVRLLVFLVLLNNTLAYHFGMLDMNHEDEILMTQKACFIATKKPAQVNYIYTSQKWNNYTINLEQNLLKCIGKIPMYVLNLETTPLEPARPFDSGNFFIIPEEPRASLQCMESIINLLDVKLRHKHFQHYYFIWRNATKDQLRNFLQQVWTKNILHAIVIVSPTRIYTFEPFTPQGFRVLLIEPRKKFFYDKLRNLHHFQLRVSMFEDQQRAHPKNNTELDGYTGVDGMVASTIVQHLNATVLYIFPADHQNYGIPCNGSYTGALKDIVSGKTQVGFNSRFLLNSAHRDVEALYPYENRIMYLIVPAAELLPQYMIFVRAFSNGTWRLLLLNFLLVMAVFALLQRCVAWILPRHIVPQPRQFRWYEIVELITKSQLGEPVEGFARISSLREFLMAWILFSYVLTSIYFAKLESNFVHPAYEEELDTIDVLEHLNVPIYGINSIIDAISVNLAPHHRSLLLSKAVHLPLNYTSTNYALVLSRENKRRAFILREETAKDFLAATYNKGSQRPTYHVVRQYLLSMHHYYVVTLGTPFSNKFQGMNNRFNEHGFLQHWTNQGRRRGFHSEAASYYEELWEDSDFDVNENGNDESKHIQYVALSLDVLQGAFYLWFLGIIFSSLGFGLEHLRFYLNIRRKRSVGVAIEVEQDSLDVQDYEIE